MAGKIAVWLEVDDWKYVHDAVLAYDAPWAPQAFENGRGIRKTIVQQLNDEFLGWPVHHTIGWPRQPRDWLP